MSRSELDDAITSAMREHSGDAPIRALLDGWIDALEQRQRRRRWLRPAVAAAAVVALAVGIGTATLSSRGDRTAVNPPILPSAAESHSVSSLPPTSSADVPQGPGTALPHPMATLPGSMCHGRYDPSLNDEHAGLTVTAASVTPVGENLYRYTVEVVNNTSTRQNLLAQAWISSDGSIAGKTLPGDVVTSQARDHTTAEPGARAELTGQLGLYVCSDLPLGTAENPGGVTPDPLAPGDYQIQIAVGNDVGDGTAQVRSPIAVSDPVTVIQGAGVSSPGSTTTSAPSSPAPVSDSFEFCEPGALDLRTLADVGLKTDRTPDTLELTNTTSSPITVDSTISLTIVNAAGDSLSYHPIPARLHDGTIQPGRTVSLSMSKAALPCSDRLAATYPDGTYSAIAVVRAQVPGSGHVNVRTGLIVIAVHDGKVLIP